MKLTREDIEKEEDYTTLKNIGRAFRQDGHVVPLKVTEVELKKNLLSIFDENYAEVEEVEEEATTGEEASTDEESTELGEDEDSSEPETEEVAELVEEVTEDEVTELVEEAIDSTEEIPEEDEEPEEDKPDLYYAERDYADWESGWGFNPKYDQPKPLPDELTPGLENALKLGKIVKV